MVEGPAGPENSGHEGGYRRPLDAHRVIGLICRYPKHKWHFKVGQFLALKAHAKSCYECNDRLDALIKRYPQKPQIGPPQEMN